MTHAEQAHAYIYTHCVLQVRAGAAARARCGSTCARHGRGESSCSSSRSCALRQAAQRRGGRWDAPRAGGRSSGVRGRAGWQCAQEGEAGAARLPGSASGSRRRDPCRACMGRQRAAPAHLGHLSARSMGQSVRNVRPRATSEVVRDALIRPASVARRCVARGGESRDALARSRSPWPEPAIGGRRSAGKARVVTECCVARRAQQGRAAPSSMISA